MLRFLLSPLSPLPHNHHRTPPLPPSSSSCCSKPSWLLLNPNLRNDPPLSSFTSEAMGSLLELLPAPPPPHRTPALHRSTWRASLTEIPVIWIVRTCVFYALLQSGIAGRPPASSRVDETGDAWAASLLDRFFNKHDEEESAREHKKLRSGWHKTTKGTLKRRYRVPTKAEGRRLLNAIGSLLSDDDSFRDATSHKGCQIRRENAHAESVCGHNVRALFDELPTPHLVVEITAFPVGPITSTHYEKAEKIEKVLRTGNSI